MTRFPKFSQLLQATLFGGAIATTAALSLLSPTLSPSARAELHNSPKAVLDEAWQIVNREYVDITFNNTDWQAIRQELLDRDYSSPEQAYDALRAALERLDDPYTRFMDPQQYDALTRQTRGELSGVGIRLQAEEDTGNLTVVEPIPNSPATAAGIRVGDRILAIDGRSTQGMSVEEASSLIRGEAGTEITLRIDRDSSSFDLSIVRARIELPTVRYALHQEGNTRVGYIRLSEFSDHAAEQMRHAIEDLERQNVDGFVLDLRGNPGGLLSASIEISRLWLDDGAIVRRVNRNGASNEMIADHTAITDLPLTVLVDGSSASSSEILTGALKDNGRATIVGTTTFGKALVQSVHPLSDGSGLAVTIEHYYTPNGSDISQRGITPDIEVSLTDEQRQHLASNQDQIGTRADPQYARAVSALQTAIASNRSAASRVSEQMPASQVQSLNLAQ